MKNVKISSIVLLAVFVNMCFMSSAAFAQLVTPLPTEPRFELYVRQSGLPEGFVQVNSIGELNTIAVGWVRAPSVNEKGAVWLGTPHNNSTPVYINSIGIATILEDVNNSLISVGSTFEDIDTVKPIVYDLLNNTYAKLSVPAGVMAAAVAINDHGVIVGHLLKNSILPSQAVIWKNNKIQYLPDGNSVSDINNSNEVVGDAYWDSTGNRKSIKYRNCFFDEYYAAINNKGEIVGTCTSVTSLKPVVVMWDNQHNSKELFQADRSVKVHDINERGEIVGVMDSIVFYFHSSTGLINLENAVNNKKNSYWLVSAKSINEFGIIVGEMIDSTTNETLGFMLVPAK